MTLDPNDHGADAADVQLDGLLRRAGVTVPPLPLDCEARILGQAALPLAARRRSARTLSIADTLAAWGRVALPLAAAAALFAAISLSRSDVVTLAEAELRESDPAALLSALESGADGALALHLIASDAEAPGTAAEAERR